MQAGKLPEPAAPGSAATSPTRPLADCATAVATLGTPEWRTTTFPREVRRCAIALQSRLTQRTRGAFPVFVDCDAPYCDAEAGHPPQTPRRHPRPIKLQKVIDHVIFYDGVNKE
jgi:hypothetical protein